MKLSPWECSWCASVSQEMFLYYDSLYEKNKELEKGSQWRKCAQKAINETRKRNKKMKQSCIDVSHISECDGPKLKYFEHLPSKNLKNQYKSIKFLEYWSRRKWNSIADSAAAESQSNQITSLVTIQMHTRQFLHSNISINWQASFLFRWFHQL